MAANSFTDRVSGSTDVDFEALAANCFDCADRGVPPQETAALNDNIAGVEPLAAGRSI